MCSFPVIQFPFFCKLLLSQGVKETGSTWGGVGCCSLFFVPPVDALLNSPHLIASGHISFSLAGL